MEMHSQLDGKEIFLQGVYDNVICLYSSLKYLSVNYSGPINTVFPVDCLIYTVQFLARSQPFSGYSNLDYIPKTIKCVTCTNRNPDQLLHSFGLVSSTLPGLLRVRYSSLAKNKGEGGWPVRRGKLGGMCQRAADSGATWPLCPFPSPATPEQTLCGFPHTFVLFITGDINHKGFFPFSSSCYLKLEIRIVTCKLSPQNQASK